MKKLNQKARVTDVDTFSDAVVVLYKNAGISDTLLSAMMEKLEVLSASLTTAIKRDKVYSGLEEADSSRDEIIKSLSAMLTGYAAVPIAVISESAGRIKAVFDKYGVALTRESYDRESSLIESLLEDLSAEALASDLAALSGLTETVEALRKAEDTFKEKTAAYIKAGSAVEESATAVKKQLILFVNGTVIPYLNSVSSMSDTYTDFANEVSARIDRVNATVSKKTSVQETAEESAE